MKYIYLSIDDNHIIKWYDYIDFFNKHKMKVTFFLSHLKDYSESAWEIIKLFKSQGHCIGFHGVNHLRAGVCDMPLEDRKKLKKKVHQYNWYLFMEKEIFAGEAIMAKYKIYPEHYSYPCGNRTDKTDERLLRVFKSLKKGGGGKYPFDNFPKVYGALNYGKKPDEYFSGHERILKNLKDGEVATLYMHEPVKHRINELIKYGYEFITIEDLVK